MSTFVGSVMGTMFALASLSSPATDANVGSDILLLSESLLLLLLVSLSLVPSLSVADLVVKASYRLLVVNCRMGSFDPMSGVTVVGVRLLPVLTGVRSSMYYSLAWDRPL